MEVKKILWPTDFSSNAARALPYVTSLSQKYQTEVHVLYVAQELAYHEPWYGEFDRSHLDKVHEWEKRWRKSIWIKSATSTWRVAPSISDTWPLVIQPRRSSISSVKKKWTWWSWPPAEAKALFHLGVSPIK